MAAIEGNIISTTQLASLDSKYGPYVNLEDAFNKLYFTKFGQTVNYLTPGLKIGVYTDNTKQEVKEYKVEGDISNPQLDKITDYFKEIINPKDLKYSDGTSFLDQNGNINSDPTINPLPSHSSSENGKVLGLDNKGSLTWVSQPDISGKANIGDSYTKTESDTKYLTAQNISGKADKVNNATANNFAALDENGNLKDSRKKSSDFATPASVTAVQNQVSTIQGNYVKTTTSGDSPVMDSSFDSASDCVRFDESQTNSEQRKQLARDNIGALNINDLKTINNESLRGNGNITVRSAYEEWLAAGNTGSEQEFLASLKAQFGSFIPADYGTDGVPASGGSDITASADTTNYIYLVDNDDTTLTAKTMWITVVDDSDPNNIIYNWTSIGDVQVDLTFGSGQAVNEVKIKDLNGEEVSGNADVLSAEAGAAMNNTLTTVDKRVGVIEPTVITVNVPFIYGKTYYPNNQHPTYVVIGEEVQIVTEPDTVVGSFNYKMVDVKPGDILNIEISQRRVNPSPNNYIVLLDSSNIVVGVDGAWPGPESTTAVTNEYTVTVPSGVVKVMVQCYGDANKVCNIVKTTVYSLKERTDDLAEEINYTEVGNLPFYAQSNKIKVSGQDITISEATNFKHFILFDILPDDVLHIKTVQHTTVASCPNYVIIVGSDNKVVEAVDLVAVTTVGDIQEYNVKVPENSAYVVVNFYYAQLNSNNNLIGVVRERNGLKKAVAGLEKKEELTFNVVNPVVDAYLKASRQYTIKDYSYSIVTNYQDNPKVRHDQPNNVKISWDVPNLANGTLCDVVISDNQNYTTNNKGFVKTLTSLDVSDGECYVYNFVPQKRYFYKVIVTLKEGFVYPLVEGTLELVGVERMIKVDNVPNVRDIGGWKTQDGRMVRYGIMYRGNALDSHGGDVTQDEVTMLTTDLGITAELDMRGASEFTTSALGEDVDFFQQDIEPNPAEGNLTNSAKCVKILQQIKSWLNYGDIVYYHCAGGCDRTGLLTFIMLALCGVNENDICRDYELSSFSIYGANYQTRQRSGDAVSQIKYWVTYFKTMAGDTLKEQVSSYLTRYDGTISGYPDTMTQADINELVELLVD